MHHHHCIWKNTLDMLFCFSSFFFFYHLIIFVIFISHHHQCVERVDRHVRHCHTHTQRSQLRGRAVWRRVPGACHGRAAVDVLPYAWRLGVRVSSLCLNCVVVVVVVNGGGDVVVVVVVANNCLKALYLSNRKPAFDWQSQIGGCLRSSLHFMKQTRQFREN